MLTCCLTLPSFLSSPPAADPFSLLVRLRRARTTVLFVVPCPFRFNSGAFFGLGCVRFFVLVVVVVVVVIV